MTRMVRKQVYITRAQDIALKRQAALLDVTESELIRRGIDRAVELTDDEKRQLWQQEMEFMEKRAALPIPPGTKPWKFNREEIYEERINRYPRRH